MGDDIDELLEVVLRGSPGTDEQLASFATAFADSARFPFTGRLDGEPVEVLGVVYEGDARRGLSALCRRDGDRRRVPLADVHPGPLTLETARLLTAYRRWLGLAPAAPPLSPSATLCDSEPWRYAPVASVPARLEEPLRLTYAGMWDPADQHWSEPGEVLDPLAAAIVAAGRRPSFEMEQLRPLLGGTGGSGEGDGVAEAARLREAGRRREAAALLEALLERDERCVEGWVRLGDLAFERGPKGARELYDVAVAIGEQSLPAGFDGLVPHELPGNRPFLAALHGLGLCAWRQRHVEDAEAIFTDLAWIAGSAATTALECLRAVRTRRRWSAGS